MDNDQLLCFGQGGFGRLGTLDTAIVGNNPSRPLTGGLVQLPTGRTAKSVSAGGGHTCVIMDNDQLLCFGAGLYGMIGNEESANVGDDPSRPLSGGIVQLPTGRTAKFVSAGNFHTCVIMDNDQLLCFGEGDDGRLGTLSITNVGDDPAHPLSGGLVQLPTGRTAKFVSAGDKHTCVIMDNDQLLCFGSGANGRLGNAFTANVGDVPSRPLSGGLVFLPTGRTAKSVHAGGSHTCVVMDDEGLTCFGKGASGQLGNEANFDEVNDPRNTFNRLVILPIRPSPTPFSTGTTTPTPSVSGTPTPSSSGTPTASSSATPTGTATPSSSGTPSPSVSPTASMSSTPTSSASPTPSFSGTPTASTSPSPSTGSSSGAAASHTAAPPDDAAGAAGTAADATDDGDATRPILYTAVALLAVVVLAGIGFALYRRRADKAAAVGVAPMAAADGDGTPGPMSDEQP